MANNSSETYVGSRPRVRTETRELNVTQIQLIIDALRHSHGSSAAQLLGDLIADSSSVILKRKIKR